MLQLGLRRVILARVMLFTLALAACSDDVVTRDDALGVAAARYLREAGFRRAEMVASLSTTANEYARSRLARYESGDARDWSRLPIWNPHSRAAPSTDTAPSVEALNVSRAASDGDLAALRALGERAFWRYPAMLVAPTAEPALRDPATARRYGFSLTSDGHVVGLVELTLPDATRALAYTCAACHSALREDGGVTAGVGNASLDLGALAADTSLALDGPTALRMRAWGPGRVDVTTLDGREPVAIPDLRAVRDQRYLQRAGAVRMRSIATLAVRVETLIITSLHEAVRPPREVSLGLALYLDGLGDALPQPVPGASRGEAVFTERCAGCHAPPGYAGGLVSPELVGADPAIARSPSRGTGMYRVPSLRGVGQRGALLHDASARDVGALLDPGRAGGHAFGGALPMSDRAALRAFLETL